MRVIVMGCFLALVLFTKAQPPDSLILFSGYVLTNDSVPITNAHLVSFRTIRSFSTNEKGFFNIWVLKGDSFMINHISFERKIIKANNNPSRQNCYLLKFEPYEISVVDLRYKEIEMKNFNKNMKQMRHEMKMSTPAYQRNTELNRYAPPSAGNQTVGINFIELINYFKTKKFRKKVEKSQ